ncbi:MAG: hypothetical protein ACRDEB_00490 [Chitinophagaceae bacterium]
MLRADILVNLNYTGENLKKLNRSLEQIESTLNGMRFKNAVLNFSLPDGKKSFHFKGYKCRLFGRREILFKEYTNEEVYKKIMKGQSGNGTERFMNFKVEIKPGNRNRRIAVSTHDDIIHTNKNDLDQMSDESFAAQLMHEYCHTIGFHHSEKKKCDGLRDCFSVPYAIGNIVKIILIGSDREKCTYLSI